MLGSMIVCVDDWISCWEFMVNYEGFNENLWRRLSRRCLMYMNASFCVFLVHMQCIEMILVPNYRSSLDLHFGILHVIFGWLCGVFCIWAIHGCTVPMNSDCRLWMTISCDPSNGSLWFLSQIVDRLKIFDWGCGLCVLISCVGAGCHSHFRRF